MISHEILQVAAFIEQSFGAEVLDQRVNDSRIVTFIEQFAAQFRGCVVAPRQRIERRDPRRARIEGFDLAAAGDATPLWRRHPGSWLPSPESIWREFALRCLLRLPDAVARRCGRYPCAVGCALRGSCIKSLITPPYCAARRAR